MHLCNVYSFPIWITLKKVARQQNIFFFYYQCVPFASALAPIHQRQCLFMHVSEAHICTRVARPHVRTLGTPGVRRQMCGRRRQRGAGALSGSSPTPSRFLRCELRLLHPPSSSSSRQATLLHPLICPHPSLHLAPHWPSKTLTLALVLSP